MEEGPEPEKVTEEEVEERGEKEEAPEEIVEERIYTIPLRRAWIVPRKERTPKAIKVIRSFIKRHMKTDSIILSREVNELIWSRGIEKPPRRIRVRAAKNKEGVVKVHVAEGD
ncbi:50S ribosomal protein L31e [Candidatus Bathyarchaeota archaeon]|nr:50S ribosomal protein L31e [Candidatus Bathyarchaeota archaeon]